MSLNLQSKTTQDLIDGGPQYLSLNVGLIHSKHMFMLNHFFYLVNDVCSGSCLKWQKYLYHIFVSFILQLSIYNLCITPLYLYAMLFSSYHVHISTCTIHNNFVSNHSSLQLPVISFICTYSKAFKILFSCLGLFTSVFWVINTVLKSYQITNHVNTFELWSCCMQYHSVLQYFLN